MEKKKFTFKIDIILFITFLILKLDGIIQWKWIWVFAPIWAVWVIQACIAIVMIIANGIANFKWNCSTKPVVSGARLVWDAKTNTLYGPWNAEDKE